MFKYYNGNGFMVKDKMKNVNICDNFKMCFK